jgi:hypothetical protein
MTAFCWILMLDFDVGFWRWVFDVGGSDVGGSDVGGSDVGGCDVVDSSF